MCYFAKNYIFIKFVVKNNPETKRITKYLKKNGFVAGIR